MNRFDQAQLAGLVQRLANRLEGDWLLIGGAAVALWLEPRRVTEDLDLIGFQGTQAERYALMDAAHAEGLPLEAVNSAADFFVRRIPGWKEETVALVRGTRSTIHRPTPSLLILLKLGRLSERDLDDCLAALAWARRQGVPVARAKLLEAIQAAAGLREAPSQKRLERLKEALLQDC